MAAVPAVGTGTTECVGQAHAMSDSVASGVSGVSGVAGVSGVSGVSDLAGAGGLNGLGELASLGLVMPSPAYLLGALVFGIAGWVIYKRGRKAQRPALTWTGVALMLYPYAVPQTWALWAIGVALCAAATRFWD